ncbi:MAG: hypothetical protein M3Y86_12460, partial [Verrucomicrobiota bacterium]|nr:hypothetical protein [Verrucomicrobiota bacterium]
MKFARIWLEYATARLVLGLLGLLPREVAIHLSMRLSRVAFSLLPKLLRVGLRNLEIAYPNLSLGERRALLAHSLESLGRVFGELSHLKNVTRETLATRVDFRVPPETLARYEEAKASGRGVIFVTPHLGNWEILVLATSALLEPITYLARPLDNPLLDRMTAKIRTRFG